jgi:hypothetical protein
MSSPFLNLHFKLSRRYCNIGLLCIQLVDSTWHIAAGALQKVTVRREVDSNRIECNISNSVYGEEKGARAVNWEEGHKSSNAPPSHHHLQGYLQNKICLGLVIVKSSLKLQCM